MEADIDPDVFVKHEVDWYDGSIRGADAELQRVLEKLGELDMEEDTLLLFVSDHGEEFLDHGGHFHEENVYGELSNVPLVAYWPGVIPEGIVVESTVQLLDVAPTLLDLAGIEIPEAMQGQSLVPLLSGDSGRRWRERPAISEWKRRRDQLGSGIDAFAIFSEGWKLIHNVERPDGYPEFELYNHGKDPLDQNDVASDHADVVERLAGQLDQWHKWALATKLPTDEESLEGMSAKELDRLRSLGYIQ